MDGQRVSGCSSENEREEKSIPLYAYSEVFHAQFPYYLSIGMTYDQYWNMDCTLVRDYRKAAELQAERKNHELWLQGMYIYDALCCASPVFRDFAKKGTKPAPYPQFPYPLTEQAKQEIEEKEEKRTFDKGMAMMEAFMKSHNKRMKDEKEQAEEGRNMNGDDD